MGKKKKKSKNQESNLAARLAKAIEAGEMGGLSAPTGISSEAFEATFAEAKALAGKGPDPRMVAKLPELFQLAFLQLAAEEKDDDQINDLAAMSDSKEVKKESRRILHKLMSQGVQVEIPERQGSSVLERTNEDSHKPLPCFITPVNGRGVQMLWLARYTRGGVAVYQAELHATDGLGEFGGGTIGRNRYKQLASEMAGDDSSLLVDMDFEEARATLAAAADRCRAAGHSLPEGYLEASGDLWICPRPRSFWNCPNSLTGCPTKTRSGP
ncbi:MAG: hypothetical protein JRF33_23365 [Deltaproteobacteria bacterium]|nr:hypothetical protein [Deltaproteobacteria bacterium]